MKSIKQILTLIIIGLILSVNILNIFAATANDDNTATFNITEEKTSNIYGMEHHLTYGTTATNTETNDGNQKINILSMKTDGINSKLVTWAIQSNQTGYTRSGLSNIAKDYEKNHPGWLVVGGINADQYYPKFGSGIGTDGSFFYANQPYYPLIMDYESRFPITPYGVSSSNYVGIKNNSENDSFVYASALSGLELEILNDNQEVIESFTVNKINETPNSGEISVWFAYNSEESSGKYINQELSSTNDIYVVEDPDLAYMNNTRHYSVGAKIDSLFGKGEITKITKTETIDQFKFAVEVANEEIKQKLSLNTYIRVQYRYQDEQMNQVESASGYHSIQRMDDSDVKGSGTYDTRRYNRSIFGKKADGTYVLMTVAKGTYAGTTHDESNAILKHYGVTEAYQQDGGGSVTAIIRNQAGTFDVVNESSDSGTKERSILNGLFFVVRDPGYMSYGMDSTRDSITITKTTNVNDQYISNVTATINNQTYQLTNEPLVIKNLEDDTTYPVELNYDITDKGKTVNITTIIYAATQGFIIPSSNTKVKSINTTTVLIEHKPNNHNYKEIKTIFNNQEYDLLKESQIRIKGLNKSTDYTLTINYIVEDPLTNKLYDSVETIEFTTRNNPFPEVFDFNITQTSNKEIKLDYTIYDESKLSQIIYLYYGTNQELYYPIDLIYNENNEIIGSITLEIDNLKNIDYDFQISITYESYGSIYFSKSDKKKFTYDSNFDNQQEVPPTNQDNNKKGCSCKKSSYIYTLLTTLSLFIIVLKKKK